MIITVKLFLLSNRNWKISYTPSHIWDIFLLMNLSWTCYWLYAVFAFAQFYIEGSHKYACQSIGSLLTNFKLFFCLLSFCIHSCGDCSFVCVLMSAFVRHFCVHDHRLFTCSFGERNGHCSMLGLMLGSIVGLFAYVYFGLISLDYLHWS